MQVTSDGQLVLFWKYLESNNSKICVYDTFGILTREIVLPRQPQLYKILLKATGNIIQIFYDDEITTYARKIVEYDSNMKIVHIHNTSPTRFVMSCIAHNFD